MGTECGLELDPDDRSEVQIDSLELYLCLLSNILTIPDPTQNSNFLHDRSILNFWKENVMDVVIELTTNIAEELEKIQYLLMDLVYQYFRMETADSMMSSTSNDQNNGNDETLQQYQREKAAQKQKFKRRRHQKWGGMGRIKMMNGQTRVQSQGTDQLSNNQKHGRRRAPKFRPIPEKKKRVYMSDGVKKALCFVATKLLDKAFSPMVTTMFYKLSRKPEFELSESSDCKKWFELISLFLHYHRISTRKNAAIKAKQDGLNFAALKWYSSSLVSCVLKEQLVHFIITRCETLFENRKFKHVKTDFSRLEEALGSYKEIVRSIYSMVQYGNDANKVNGLKLFDFIFNDHRGPQLINDMIKEYKQFQSTKLCLSYCIEAVYYTIKMIEIMKNSGTGLTIKSRKKKKKKPQQNAVVDEEKEENNENVERNENEEDEEKMIVEVAGMEIHDGIHDEDEDQFVFDEQDFDFDAFLKSYATNKVVAQYMYILEDYATNSAKLNSYIIELFNKLAFKLNFAPLLFQLSYFLLFNQILNDRILAKDKNFNIVRKFCQKIVREFFIKSKENPVLFCEILFHKTPHALDDINEPGSVHQKIIEKAEKESRRQNRRNDDMDNALDIAMDDDFDDEEEYEQLDIDMTPWSEAEDALLRNYFGTYSQQSNVANILQDFLEKELKISRSVAQINHRLQTLGLQSRPKKKRNKRQKDGEESKKRIKPKDLNIAQRKNIIFHCVHAGCTASSENKAAFKWMSDKLNALQNEILEVIGASSNVLLDDMAIVPVAMNEFKYLDNESLIDLLRKLGFLAPNKYLGTCWWRIPREFKTSDLDQMVELMTEAIELPNDADLNELCPLNGESMNIQLLHDDSGNVAPVSMMQAPEPQNNE